FISPQLRLPLNEKPSSRMISLNIVCATAVVHGRVEKPQRKHPRCWPRLDENPARRSDERYPRYRTLSSDRWLGYLYRCWRVLPSLLQNTAQHPYHEQPVPVVVGMLSGSRRPHTSGRTVASRSASKDP